MKFVIQRTTKASVVVDGKTVGAINGGFVVLVGIGADDTREIADKMIKKMLALRIFDDENGKTNLALSDVGGELLIISQFTLYADCKHGNRPSFVKAGAPDHAEALYDYITGECAKQFPVQTGIFGAEMTVSLVNDGPFTIILDSNQLFTKENKNGSE